MLMFWSLSRRDVAEAIEAAVSAALDAGWRTGDLANPDDQHDGLVVVGTTGMATAVIKQLQALQAPVPA
jgi:isocitrate/isopropylmalate dehydrogenase